MELFETSSRAQKVSTDSVGRGAEIHTSMSEGSVLMCVYVCLFVFMCVIVCL